MFPMGSTTYNLVKLEQEHRLARIERRHRHHDGEEHERTHRQPAVSHARPHLQLSRRLTIASATAAGLLVALAGATLAFPG